MLVNIIRRAQYLFLSGEKLPASEPLKLFLKNRYTIDDFQEKRSLLQAFGRLDDHDIWGAIKLWRSCRDFILSQLCEMIVTRDLFQIQLSVEPIKKIKSKSQVGIAKKYNVLRGDTSYLFSQGWYPMKICFRGSNHQRAHRSGTWSTSHTPPICRALRPLAKSSKKLFMLA